MNNLYLLRLVAVVSGKRGSCFWWPMPKHKVEAQGRKPHPVYPLTGLALGPSHLAKKPHTHALVTQFSYTLGAKQPSPLAIPNYINLSKRKLESLYLLRLLLKIDFCLPTWIGLFQTPHLSLQVHLNAILPLWQTNTTLVLSQTFMFRG